MAIMVDMGINWVAIYLYFTSLTLHQVSLNDSFCNCPGTCLCINLEGEWNIKRINSNDSRLRFSGAVPGNVYTALYSKKIIGDPYAGENDEKYRWVALNDWQYARKFHVSNDIKGMKNIDIVFEGIDMASEISVNGHHIGQTSNMFVKYTFSIGEYLEPGENEIEVYFHSPIKYAAARSQDYKDRYGYMVPPITRPAVEHGDKHVNFIRKEPCSFGWDWGPSFPTVGIWRPVFIRGYDIGSIEYVTVNAKKDDSDYWSLDVTIIVRSYIDNKKTTICLHFPKLNMTKTFPCQLNAGETKCPFKMNLQNISDIEEWWPRGFGKQTLYTLQVSLLDEGGKIQSEKKIKFGFRTVELVQEKIKGSQGLSFFFKVNSVPIFLKGSNWIPADAFKDNVTFDKVENLLQSTYDANMNILRVWGGGIYEDDSFYEISDELGILLWHDLMFACAMYPTDEEFLKNVSLEVRHQVRRLQHHPSILVWSGNNENEVGLAQNWYQTASKMKLFKKDYVTLYVKTIKPIVQEEDSFRPFIVSSPSNGVKSEEEEWVSADPQSEMYGDVHFYDYFSDCWDLATFPNPRMATEYGYQSYPSLHTLNQIANTSDLSWGSQLMDHRQHHEYGNKQIEDMIQKHFELPSSKNPVVFFEGMIYLSQITQALCIKHETEHYRRLRGNLIHGQGHTMGAMYWQLNDIWQAPSWSSIEYGGNWKMLHYFAKDFFAPILASAYIDGAQLVVYVISDLLSSVSEATLKIRVFSWDSFDAIFTKESKVDIPPEASTKAYSLDLNNTSSPMSNCVAMVTIATDKHKIPSSPVYFTSLKKAVGLKDPNIKIKEIKKAKKDVFQVKIHAESPAAFVWLSSNIKGRFSENGFLLVAPFYEVQFYCWEEASTRSFSDTLVIRSLFDLYRK